MNKQKIELTTDLFVSYEDLNLATKAKIHTDLMNWLRDNLDGDLSDQEEFSKLSLMADDLIKDLEFTAHVEIA